MFCYLIQYIRDGMEIKFVYQVKGLRRRYFDQFLLVRPRTSCEFFTAGLTGGLLLIFE